MNRAVRATLVAGLSTVAVGGLAGCSPTPNPAAPAPGTVSVRDSIPPGVAEFTMNSPDLTPGQSFPTGTWSGTFGCHGGNRAPRVHWSGAPATARSFAVTMFDPDAPTGSGFWHWLAWDIPAGTTDLADQDPPGGIVVGINGAGIDGYLGPCPPKGDHPHHYQLTVLALDMPTLGLSKTTQPAAVMFTMNPHIIGYARLTVTAQQP